MSKRRPEHDSSQNISSSKLSRGCIILSDDRIKLPEVISHLDSNFEDLISRGEHSKILILDGTHGSKDGGDSLTEKTFYEPSFMEETCEALGTRHNLHRRRLPRYEKIKPYPEQCLRDWKRRGEFHDGISITSQEWHMGKYILLMNSVTGNRYSFNFGCRFFSLERWPLPPVQMWNRAISGYSDCWFFPFAKCRPWNWIAVCSFTNAQ